MKEKIEALDYYDARAMSSRVERDHRSEGDGWVWGRCVGFGGPSYRADSVVPLHWFAEQSEGLFLQPSNGR